jgi:hypothetical protein
MAVIAACAVLVAAGIACVVRWRAGPRPGMAPRYLLGLAVAGPVAGLLAAGAGGRLIMRLLALTSPDADGQITEAGETIGEISVAGTAGFVLFAGVPAGALALTLFVLAGSLLPGGRVGGVVLGLVLLVLVGAQLEPLRADNFDFNLVGPDWLSLLSFPALALFQGMLTWALAGRYGCSRCRCAGAPSGSPRRSSSCLHCRASSVLWPTSPSCRRRTSTAAG